MSPPAMEYQTLFWVATLPPNPAQPPFIFRVMINEISARVRPGRVRNRLLIKVNDHRYNGGTRSLADYLLTLAIRLIRTGYVG